VYEGCGLETSCIAVQRAKNLSLRPADCLSLLASLTDICAETQLEILGGAASILELLEFTLILEDHSGRLVAITPASVAHLSEREIEVGTGNTNPVTDAL